MKENRDTNVVRLIEWCAFSGKKNPREWLRREMNCSKSTVNQMFRGVTPGPVFRIRVSSATGISLDELFPKVSEAEGKSA